MRDISAVVEELRAVRLAQRTFLKLWAMEQAFIFPALDRVTADMNAVRPVRGLIEPDSLTNDPQSADETQ